MAEFGELSDGDQAKEGEARQPGEVSVGIILDSHGIDTKEFYDSKKAELKAQLKKSFSPEAKNIILLEDAFTDIPWREAFLQGFERHHSFRKAGIFATGVRKGLSEKDYPEFEASLDEEVFVKDVIFANHPGKQPVASYVWVERLVIDELIDEGYDIRPVFEEGVEEADFPGPEDALVSDIGFEVLKNKLIKLASTSLERNTKIAEQIEELAARAKADEGQTNIAMIIGRGHESLISLLPPDLQTLTSPYFADYPKKPLSSIEVVVDKLMKGKDVSDKDWERIRQRKKPTALVKAKYNLRSRMRKN